MNKPESIIQVWIAKLWMCIHYSHVAVKVLLVLQKVVCFVGHNERRLLGVGLKEGPVGLRGGAGWGHGGAQLWLDWNGG